MHESGLTKRRKLEEILCFIRLTRLKLGLFRQIRASSKRRSRVTSTTFTCDLVRIFLPSSDSQTRNSTGSDLRVYSQAMTRKRDKPSFSRHVPAPISKRRRPFPRPPHDPSTASAADDDPKASKPAPPPALVVTGLPSNCSVLELKSRFEIYGPISRIRIDRDEVGYITFRSKDSAVAAIGASLDPSFGITVETKRVQVSWANDPLAQWGVGVGINRVSESRLSSSSKLVKAEVPLSKHGHGNKLASTIVKPQSSGGSTLEAPFQGREIVAYDDIL